ncbi:hypothetical protein [Geodermatophilus marinus]|uniref:hypothetical protein n=1 Tax=Geodermatophilus sp. LHW52908 TaxID=2303986 RepID=UPI000E3D074E|nr:hypothetical protein [Geodermatophilus sp. LHW52908]RFU23437.1 hypothetical protein D0Z06_02040 [Geodermatophilus sp. LHW52908]
MMSSPGAWVRRLPTLPAPGALLALAGVAAVSGWAPVVPAGLLAVAVLDALATDRDADADAGQARRVDAALGTTLWGLVLLLHGAREWSPGVLRVVVVALAVQVCLVALTSAVHTGLDGLHRYPAARGLPGVGAVPLVRRPSAQLVALLPQMALLVPAVLAPQRPAVVAAAAGAGLLAGAAAVVRWVLALHRARGRRQAVLQGMRDHLRSTHPTVVLYAGEGVAALHEVTMWLPSLERLSVDAVLLMRNRRALERLPATTLPVLCVPGATDLMSLPLERFRVGLFVSNVGNNIHLLRVPGVRTAFIGHGDSDKNASANPYSKVYDEIWVAGPAGRDRYLRADTGVRPDAVVEVGRPQLELVRRAPATRPDVVTLLYAPTWEGWNSEQDYASVASHGEALVRAVLGHPDRIRLVYRPHPYAGRRSPAVAAAHRRIVDLLGAANQAAGVDVPTVLEAEPAPEASSAASAERDAVRRGEQRLAERPPTAHVVLGAGAVPLISSLNAASALVTDVSSVLTDFLASDKPVAVCDAQQRGPERFVADFPSAASATVLATDPAELAAFCDVVTGRRPDPAAPARAGVRRQLLGPAEPTATARFDAAVTALAARAHALGPVAPDPDPTTPAVPTAGTGR